MHNPPGIQDRPVLPVRAEGPRSSAICLLRAAEAAAARAAAAGGHRVRGDAVCDGLLSTHHSLTLPWLSPSGVQAIEFVDATVPTVGSDAGLFNYILNTTAPATVTSPKHLKRHMSTHSTTVALLSHYARHGFWGCVN